MNYGWTRPEGGVEDGVRSIRTLLFVPADRPDRIASALRRSADAVAVDLEDAVTPEHKSGARDSARRALGAAGAHGAGPLRYLRINALSTEWATDDLALVAELAAQLAGVIVPKVAAAGEIETVRAALPPALSVLAIIESARGVLAAASIATADGVAGLILGSLDLAADLRVEPDVDRPGLAHARSHVVLACAAAGLPSPLDGPHPELDDDAGLTRSSRALHALGFGGRVVIHPRQIASVAAAFAPTEDELDWARTVLAAAAAADGAGAIRLPDGTFVDRPVVSRATRLLASSGEATR